MKHRRLRAGEWVEVRSKEEILRTLDEKGQLDGLPFMPNMFAYCGQRLRVHKRAHKTCDTVFPVRGRRMLDSVHLGTRCDGEPYGGCQASCLIFWKDAWLKRVVSTDLSAEKTAAEKDPPLASGEGCTEQDVWAGTRAAGPQDAQDPAYVCQATQLPYASNDLAWWDPRQYVEDYTSGNVGLWRIVKGFVYSCYSHLTEADYGQGRVMRRFYDTFHPLWRGTLYPRRRGTIPADVATPLPPQPLNLQPGEWVRVKSHTEILRTLNTQNKNRGLYFDAEMVPYCGGTYRVLKRVSKILDERTGKMSRMRTESILLEGAVCQSRYSTCRMFCPRGIYPFWREIWLERVSGPSVSHIQTRDSRDVAPAFFSEV
jgi:hypothetical protein